MKITFIGHAKLLIQVDGLNILSDPWWDGPSFGQQWWHYPEADLDVLKNLTIDYIYLSHGHHDHYHPKTLEALDKNAKILCSSDIGLAGGPRSLGFEVIEISKDEEISLNENVKCRIIPTYSDDTLFAVTHDKQTCINLNDALHSAPSEVQDQFIERLNNLYPSIDYLFCGYGIASHFPNCYQIPGKDIYSTAALRQHYFNEQWVKICHGLQPKYAFPFAADVVLLDDELIETNSATHNQERPTNLLQAKHPGTSIQAIDIGPGFCIENGVVLNGTLREKVNTQQIQDYFKKEIEVLNQHDELTDKQIEKIKILLEKNYDICKSYLQEYQANFRFLIKFRESKHGILINKNKTQFSFSIVDNEIDQSDIDVTLLTRFNYLELSLGKPYGDETLFVGSGGIFTYSEKGKKKLGIHSEFVCMLKHHKKCPMSRYGKSSKIMVRIKSLIKSLLGIKNQDLYDIKKWTKFSD